MVRLLSTLLFEQRPRLLEELISGLSAKDRNKVARPINGGVDKRLM